MDEEYQAKAAAYARIAREAQEAKLIESCRTYEGDDLARGLIRRLVEERDKDRCYPIALFPALVAMISDISERAWSAGWYTGCEELIWCEAIGEPVKYRRLFAGEGPCLLRLAELIGGWAAWEGEEGVAFVPMDAWRERMAKK